MFSKVNRNDYNNIDCIKVCMAVLVVATHTEFFSFIKSQNVSDILTTALSIKVPFFFTASGFLVWKSVVDASIEEKLKKVTRWLSKTKRLYIVWTLIFLPYTIYGFYNSDLSFTKSCVVFIRNVLLVGQNYLSWPLWYLLGMLVAGYIYKYLLIRKAGEYVIYSLAAILAITGIMIDWLHDNNLLVSLCDGYYSLFQTTRNGFFQGFPYIIIGISIAQRGVLNIRLLYVVFVLAFSAHMLGFKLATFVMTYALFSIVIQYDFKPRQDNLYKNLRLTSTIVYFVHMLYVGVFLLLCPIKFPNVLLFVVVVACSFLTSYIVIKNKNKRIVKFCFR